MSDRQGKPPSPGLLSIDGKGPCERHDARACCTISVRLHNPASAVDKLIDALSNDDVLAMISWWPAPPVNFPSAGNQAQWLNCGRFDRSIMKTQKPKQWADREVQQLSKLAPAGAGVSKSRSRAGPSRRICEANGAKDRDTVEEIAVEEARIPARMSAAPTTPNRD